MQTKTEFHTGKDLYKKTRCRYCESPLPSPFLDLGVMPLANSFLNKEELTQEEFTCPLRLSWCPACGLVQLNDVVPPERMFSNYLYVTSTTKTFQKHFADYARSVKSRLPSGITSPLAVDIGSNDGLLLSCYQAEGMRAIGVEPAQNLSRLANEKGLTTLNDYFGKPAVDKIRSQWGRADVISGNNVFAHIDDIHSVCENVRRLLGPKGIFMIEFPYLLVMVEQMLFDMIYHEHLSYIAVSPLQLLLARFEMEIFDIEEVSSHGGSLRVFVQKKDAGQAVSDRVRYLVDREKKAGYGHEKLYAEFAGRVQSVKRELTKFVNEAKAQKKSIAGYGAPAKGNTLINFCRWSEREIDYLVDDNPLKQGLCSPGGKIPVVSFQHLTDHPTDFVILFAWNFAGEILKKLEPLRTKGVQFIIPLPRPRIIR